MKHPETFKENPFSQPPEQYFQTLPQKIQKRIHTPKTIGFDFSSLFLSMRYALPVVLLLGVAWWHFKPTSKPTHTTDIASLSKEEITAYLLEEGISEEEIFAYTDANTVSEDVKFDFSEETIEEELDIENLEDYL